MTENYCLIDVSDSRSRKRANKNSGIVPVLALIVLLVTGATCWWSDQVLTEVRARGGNAEAEYNFGKRRFAHAHSAQERNDAVGLIRKAAEQGNPKAQTALGVLYLKGSGVPRDFLTGVNWLQKAAGQDWPEAQNELGVMYATGRGLTQDLDQAAHWCGKAAARGLRIAQKNLDLIQTAKRNPIGQIATSGGERCLNPHIERVEADGVMVEFRPEKGGFGLAKLKTANLPVELRHLQGYTATAPSKLLALLHLDTFSSML